MPPAQRLDMNYVWVHIWPTIDADLEQLTALQGQIAPMTAGAGIEEVLVGGTVALPDGRIRWWWPASTTSRAPAW